MSELVAMRQRIKAIETIKKVTHAMRLISMSGHSRLRGKKNLVESYQEQITTIIKRILAFHPSWHHPVLWPKNREHNPLIIIVGSQKGLCGNFNVNLFSFLEREVAKQNQQNLHIITVGKKAVDYGISRFDSTIMQFEDFTQTTTASIARTIGNHIWHTKKPYSSVIIYYNFPKSFFVQKPEAYNLIPFTMPIAEKKDQSTEEYIWEQKPELILDTLGDMLIQSSLNTIFIQSLIAEQAARFVAMDNSTRNAKNLLEAMQLEYNKTRQTKITRELTDLAASF